MFDNIDFKKILFFDIETVSSTRYYNELPSNLQYHWQRKCKAWSTQGDAEALGEELYEKLYSEKAGIYAEFGRIVCISMGYLYKDENGVLKTKIKSFYSEKETEILAQFNELLEKYFNNPTNQYLLGHNIKEFDIPYICRRLIINGMDVPKILDLAGKKPWESKHLLDTLEWWKFGDYKSFTSLDLLASVLGIESSKSDIDGSQVGGVFYEENDLKRIAKYCERDVLVLVQLFLRLQNLKLLGEDQIEMTQF